MGKEAESGEVKGKWMLGRASHTQHPSMWEVVVGRSSKLEASLGYIVRPEKLKEGRKGREKRRRQNDGGGRAEGRGNNMALFPSVSSAQGKGIFL